jgi:hypothetical protein
VFDCWYSPGVLTDPPSERVKTLRGRSNGITRFAQPVMRVKDDLVEINYRFGGTDRESGSCSEFYEKHVMRYFFVPELLWPCKSWGWSRWRSRSGWLSTSRIAVHGAFQWSQSGEWV